MSVWIEWVEPFGLKEEPVYMRVPLQTAVDAQKFSAASAKPGFTYETDEAALDDFITVRWAWKIEAEPPR